LHATTRYTAALPDGDAGGNGFRIQMPPDAHIANLHSFWDAAAGAFTYASPKRPLDQAGKDRIRAFAEEVMKENPSEGIAGVSDLDAHTWVVESNTLAREVVYKNIVEGETPSKAYTDAAQKLSRKRIATAGYRLAGVLNALFIKPSTPTKTN
jgi:hypothetical protein